MTAKVVKQLEIKVDGLVTSAPGVATFGIKVGKPQLDELLSTYAELTPYVILEAATGLSNSLGADSEEDIDDRFETSINNLMEIFEDIEGIEEEHTPDIQTVLIGQMYNTAFEGIDKVNNHIEIRESLEILKDRIVGDVVGTDRSKKAILDAKKENLILGDYLESMSYNLINKDDMEVAYVILVFNVVPS